MQVAVKLFGTLNDGSDTDEGMLIEVAVPKSAVGLAGADSFRVSPVLVNKDQSGSTVTDTMTVSTTDTTYWPSVVLD